MLETLISPWSEYVVYGSSAGLLLGLLFFLLFLSRRLHRTALKLRGRAVPAPGLLASLRNLSLIFLWTAFFGLLLFFGFFLRAYQTFNDEQPVAEITAQPLEASPAGPGAVLRVSFPDSGAARNFFIRGDQWMIEGDILKWDPLLNFLGFHTRYRLTRLRGRYLKTADEKQGPSTIHSLVAQEDHPFWRRLYEFGPRMPLVSTVYGNAVFHTSSRPQAYQVFVGTSGFIVREIETPPR